jgi:RNA polymerase sigma-70 factor (ECF subfamily)
MADKHSAHIHPDTFQQLLTEHQLLIRKICRIYTDNPQDHEELFQEICLQLWRSFPGFSGQAKFSTWLYQVGLNTAISIFRRSNRNSLWQSHQNLDQIPAKEDEDLGKDIDQLFSAIQQLPEIDRAIIFLWLESKSYDEIAYITGLSKVNVSVKLVRIKEKLEKILNSMEGKS